MLLEMKHCCCLILIQAFTLWFPFSFVCLVPLAPPIKKPLSSHFCIYAAQLWVFSYPPCRQTLPERVCACVWLCVWLNQNWIYMTQTQADELCVKPQCNDSVWLWPPEKTAAGRCRKPSLRDDAEGQTCVTPVVNGFVLSECVLIFLCVPIWELK